MPTSRPASFFQYPKIVWPWSKPNLTIGLDLDSQAITFVDLREAQGQHFVSQWGIERLAPNVIQDGRIKNRGALISVLTALVEKNNLRGASVAMGVNGASVMVKRISVSQCHQHELDEYVMWEAPQYIPYDPEDVYLDFSPCSSRVLGETEDMDLLLVAAKREAVDERREVLEAVQLRPVICDIEGLAFLNWTSMIEVVQQHKTYLMANLRESMMNVVMVVQGEPLLVRDVTYSSVSDQDIVNMNSSDHAQTSWGNSGQRASDHESSHIENLFRFEILSELKRTIEGAREILPSLDIEQVFLAGHLAESLGLQEELRHGLSISVCHLTPATSLKQSKTQERAQALSPIAYIAEGLALRALQG